MESEELAVDVCRVNNFLVNNQLVQANGITQKVESALQADIMGSNSVEPEKNPFFLLFRKVHMTRTYILAGKKDEALAMIREVAKMLPGKESQ